MRNDQINANGLKWGIIIGVIYCLLLFARYNLGATNPIMFSFWVFLGYVIVLILLLISGFNTRKKLGGYIELKEAFKSMFISVLLFELFYAIFNFIYIKYIDPNFFQTLRDSMEAFLQKSNQSQEQIDKALGSIDVDSAKKMGIFDSLKTYLFFVGISGIFSFLFALIVKRKNTSFDLDQNNIFQAGA